MHRKISYSFMFCILLVFVVVTSQGCGGGGNSLSGRSNDDNSGSVGGSVIVGGDTILESDGFDTDNNGKPDFLDFDGVNIIHANSSSSASSINAQIPSMIFFRELKTFETDEPDSVSVNLTAGTEYTVEFSRNLTDPIELFAPIIEILDPVSNEPLQYFFDDDAELPYDRIQLTGYPEEAPSIICMTFKPSVTGTYVIRISRAELNASEEDSTEDNVTEDSTEEFYNMIVEAIGQEEADALDETYGDGPEESSPDVTDDSSCVLFIYEELRNEDGEPGYYTRFKFTDDYGNTTDTIDISDIIEMRKLFLAIRPDYLEQYYGETPYEGDPDEFTDEELENFFEWLYLMQEYNGLFNIEDDDVEVSSVSIVNPSATRVKTKTNIKSNRSNINATMAGMKYDSSYSLGSGFFGITGYQAKGHAIQTFTLPVPKTKRVSSHYKAEFISSQQEQEKFSKTTANGSFSAGGFGLSASLSSMSSYKFGLTSTTMVIHYDELETTERILNISDYKLTKGAANELAKGSTNFRNSYGDYFVAGYVYGGTYDAYISITTETVEQLKEVKSKLTAKYQSLDKKGAKASAEAANEMKDILKQNKASVSIEIRTSGSSASAPDAKIITPKNGQDNVDSIGEVISELLKFRSALSKQSPANFAPVSVVLKRYSLLSPVLARMNRDKDDGTIPISPSTAVVIQSFNRSLITLGAYNQVIAGLDNTKIDAEVRNGYDDRYENIIATVTSDPNFYSNSSKVTSTQKNIKTLSSQLKATGDRYVFYQMLVAAQQREREMYNKYETYKDDASDEKTHFQPFGGDWGGSTGYNEFFVSAAVTSDIKAGVSVTLDGRQSYKAAGRRYWGTSEHNMDNVARSYTAKTAKGGTDALFCYVTVTGENDDDRHRRFSNYPVAGKSELVFDFTSGYSCNAKWVVKYQTMNFTREKYPFFGLER